MTIEMSITLYRKYRPQIFADICGQNHIKVTLGNEIATGRVAHAYLFTGPRGTGKTTTARILAKAVNCEKREREAIEPCNSCEACLSITENRALDVIEIDAASHTGVDNVRENIIENVRFTPSRLKNKVFIIDEVHMLSTSAWNALLKTLEEPPARVILILATTEVAKIPATIISRCQRFDFHRITADSLVERLKKLSDAEGVTISREVLYTIARYADGGLRDAESMLGQILAIGENNITSETASIVLPRSSFESVLSFMDILARRSSCEALSAVGRLVEEGVDPRFFTDELIEFSRKLLLAKFSGSLQEFTVGFDTALADQIIGLGKSFGSGDLTELIERLLAAREGSAKAKIAQLPLELAVLGFCESGKETAVGAFVPRQEAPEPPRATQSQARPNPDAREVLPQTNLTEEAVQKNENEIGAASNSEVQPEEPPAEKKELEKIVPMAESVEESISLERVLELWPEFIKRLQLETPSLRVALGVGRPLEVKGNVLTVGVQYKFHAGRLNEVKSRLALEKVLSELFGVPLRIEAIVADDFSAAATQADSLVKKALLTFGGKVIG